MDIKYFGVVDNGVLYLDSNEGFNKNLSMLEGQRVECVVKKRIEPKTVNQTAYFHAVVLKYIAEAMGYDPDNKYDLEEVKDNLKHELGCVRQTTKGSKVYMSLADYTKGELSKFIDQCIRLAAEKLDCVVPDATQVEY